MYVKATMHTMLPTIFNGMNCVPAMRAAASLSRERRGRRSESEHAIKHVPIGMKYSAMRWDLTVARNNRIEKEPKKRTACESDEEMALRERMMHASDQLTAHRYKMPNMIFD